MDDSGNPQRGQPDVERSDEELAQEPDRQERPTPDEESTQAGPPPGWLYSPVDHEYRPISGLFDLSG